MLAADQNRVTVVDINPRAFDYELARSYFRLAPQVVVDDARHHLETTSQMFDAIALGRALKASRL